MKKNLTELVFILDRSGSMAGLEADTIGGFNAMLEKQKRQPGEAYVSTVLFDNDCEVIYDRLPLDRVSALTEREYNLVLLMAERLTNREIAETLFLSEGSVKQYINQIYSKLHIEGDARSKRKRLLALLLPKT